MASRRLEDAHSLLQTQFTQAKKDFESKNAGIQVILTCSYRSPAEQNALYNQPWDKKDNNGNGRIDEAAEKVTQAKGLQSPHNYMPSFAIDVSFVVNGKTDWSEKWFRMFAPYMKHAQIEWGGTWKFLDLPHYEVKGWKKMVNN
jgi:peptidoglycan L-alanyl-D-glutamate endopeptidase CwlK